MPADTQPSHAATPPTTVRLKLVMPDHGNLQAQTGNPNTPAGAPRGSGHESSGSPQRPSYSPVTPTLPHASLPHANDRVELPPAQFLDQPDPVPMNLDDNPDAMALRATLSILQLQRQQALRDMRDLDKMKEAAMGDPEQFVKDLQQGRLTRPGREGVEVDVLEDAEEETTTAGGSKFGKFPAAQNVMRCPPVEWAKYHVVGDALDRVHEVQQHYPGYSQEEQGSHPGRPQPHTVAAPYRPFIDRLDNTRANPKS
ncbi:hypothetical protein A1O1_07934 [Capronia coronata CBS 617.96]|uniref:Uncharacterized protein n=1 Tax=Capronia coronata CBS 617.96 TaxID=1182541 RepID=W9YHW9_9EURO|nr:uncharacterized protein A1O1_07934 [Capronia coronata CBS 617.96]EXJ81869.1 hypothetical protein A1O1_07934 [Capronia coronata CBS 617.96]